MQLSSNQLEPGTRAFYRRAIAVMQDAQVPFLVCGAYAFEVYTGIARHTKDLDIFVRKQDCAQALRTFAAEGYTTELTFPHWLAKAYGGGDFVDIIFSSGNGLCPVDDSWFAHAVEAEVVGMPVKLCPPEEIIWQKAFVMERERFDGADVVHLLRALSRSLDWERLVKRFEAHWRVLLAHLVLHGYIYPTHRDDVPDAVLNELLGRLRDDAPAGASTMPLCHGPMLSREQYLPDLERWGYIDARLRPWGNMSSEEIDQWTVPIAGSAAKASPTARIGCNGHAGQIPEKLDKRCAMPAD